MKTMAKPTVGVITEEVSRHNELCYIVTQLLIYFSAPVIYVGVVQAAFCDQLGASATISNLPSSTFLLGFCMPIVCAWLFTSRLEKRVVEVAFAVVAFSMLSVCLVVFLPCPGWVRLAVVIAQGLIVGGVTSITNVYMFKCLSRGTTSAGRARGLKFAFGFGPIAAVLGSLGAQALLDGRLSWAKFPYNFGVLYLIALPCMTACSLISRRYRLIDVQDEQCDSFFRYLVGSARDFCRDRVLALTWLSLLAWSVTISSTANLSLYSQEAVGRTPMEMAGAIMAMRFGFKAVAGFGLGALGARCNPRVTILVPIFLVGMAALWPFVSSGYGYLLAFGLMGAGELGAIYFSNLVVHVSSPAVATRNLSLLTLATPLASIAPAIYGGLSDRLGFHASFVFGGLSALFSFVLMLAIRPSALAHRCEGPRKTMR